MSIKFLCVCGKKLQTHDESAGKKTRCPRCGVILRIPRIDAGPPAGPVAPPTPGPGTDEDDGSPYDIVRPARPSVPSPDESTWTSRGPGAPRPLGMAPVPKAEPQRGGPVSILEYTYLLLLFTMIPLTASLIKKEPTSDLQGRIARTIAKAPPEDQERLGKLLSKPDLSLEEALAAMPGGRLYGAHLSRDSTAHWAYAAIASAGFLLLLALCFSVERADPATMLGIGAFTGTVGIVFLLLVQFCSNFRLTRFRGGGIIVLILLILTFIGWSYDSANDPDSNFLLSALGFTFGVGLCEEFTKAIPLFFFMKQDSKIGWRVACLWGLASGIGFGVSEGIMYSANFYNGLSGYNIYLVRFISCVALHAMWSASVGIAIARNVRKYEDIEDAAAFGLFAIRVIAVPMALHGFYDTLLKKELNGWAIIVALLSYGWLVWHIELARGHQPGPGRPKLAKKTLAY